MITAEEIKKAVNGQLSGYPWGGECIDVHKNQWGEWIADCHVWGVRNGGTHLQVAYWEGDPNCPVSQFMIECHRKWGFDYVKMWEAENNMRKASFSEEGGFFDPDAPRSPYILAKIKASIEKHACLFQLQEMWNKFADTPINSEDEIEQSFYFWEAGTSRFDIWHWFDELCPNGLAVDLMGETPKTVF